MSKKNLSTNKSLTNPKLIDNFGREVNYLRLSVTDRCNLRCTYCMPEEGIPFIPHEQILSYEEIFRIVSLFSELGITKLRITGGEPFVRKGLVNLLENFTDIPGLQSIHLTTNGLLIGKYIKRLKQIGIAGINVSLDTLQADRFKQITRREGLQTVLSAIEQITDAGIPLKINTVIQPNFNFDEIIPIARLAEEKPVEVRFIEQMPFNGYLSRNSLQTGAETILQELKNHFPELSKNHDNRNSTADIYSIPNFTGSIGIIAGYSRTFCDTCSRVRVNAVGSMQTCLYDRDAVNFRDMLREGWSDKEIKNQILSAVNNRTEDGFDAEKRNKAANFNSMATIGG